MRFDAHAPHQGRDVLALDPVAFATQQIAQHAAAGERMLQGKFVDPAYQREILSRDLARLVLGRSARQSHNPALQRERQFMGAVDHSLALGRLALLSALSEKSFSSVSCPILA